MKIIKGLLIGVAVEMFFAMGTPTEELESFFLLFSLFFGVLFIYNLFTYATGNRGKGLVKRSGMTATSLNKKLSEDLYATEMLTRRAGGGVFDPTNIVFIIFTIINIMAYILVMPK